MLFSDIYPPKITNAAVWPTNPPLNVLVIEILTVFCRRHCCQLLFHCIVWGEEINCRMLLCKSFPLLYYITNFLWVVLWQKNCFHIFWIRSKREKYLNRQWEVEGGMCSAQIHFSLQSVQEVEVFHPCLIPISNLVFLELCQSWCVAWRQIYTK